MKEAREDRNERGYWEMLILARVPEEETEGARGGNVDVGASTGISYGLVMHPLVWGISASEVVDGIKCISTDISPLWNRDTGTVGVLLSRYQTVITFRPERCTFRCYRAGVI